MAMNPRMVGALLVFSLLLPGCNAPEEEIPEDGASSSSGSSSTSSTSSSSTSSTSSTGGPPSLAEFCESQQIYDRAFDSPAYPLVATADAGELHLSGAGFEDPAVGAESIAHNTDPMYIYSGNGSAHLVDRPFNGALGGDQELLNAAQQLSFWIYLADEEPEEFIISAGGATFQAIAPDGSGWGFSGTMGSLEEAVTIEPHQWVQVSMDVAGAFGNCSSFMQIRGRDEAGDEVEFYIDDIGLNLEFE